MRFSIIAVLAVAVAASTSVIAAPLKHDTADLGDYLLKREQQQARENLELFARNSQPTPTQLTSTQPTSTFELQARKNPELFARTGSDDGFLADVEAHFNLLDNLNVQATARPDIPIPDPTQVPQTTITTKVDPTQVTKITTDNARPRPTKATEITEPPILKSGLKGLLGLKKDKV